MRLIICDDFSVYNGYDVAAQQKCLAHLRRHFKKLIQLPGLHNKAIGETFIHLIDEVFQDYSRWQESSDDVSYNDWATQFKFKLQSTLHQWFELAGGTAKKLLRSLRDKAQQWWYFLDHPQMGTRNYELRIPSGTVGTITNYELRITNYFNAFFSVSKCHHKHKMGYFD